MSVWCWDLGWEAHLKTLHKQNLKVLILEKGRWHGLVVSDSKKKKKKEPTRIPWWKQLLLSLNSKSVIAGGCCVAAGSNCDTQLLEFVLFKFFMFKSTEGKQRRGAGSLININIIMCGGGKEDLSGLLAFIPVVERLSLSVCLAHPFPSVSSCSSSDCYFHCL